MNIFAAAYGICHLCGCRIKTGEKWEVEHVIPLGLDGKDDETNMRPAHTACHAPKTKEDVGRIAKAKRQAAKHLGIRRSRSPMPGSRASKWKRKIDGTVVPR